MSNATTITVTTTKGLEIEAEACNCATCGVRGIYCDTDCNEIVIDGATHMIEVPDGLVRIMHDGSGKPICDECAE